MNWDMNSDEYNDLDEQAFEVELKNQRYYFQLVMDNELLVGDHYFLICPKDYFDVNGCMYDGELEHLGIMPPGFEELTESIFMFHIGQAQAGRQVLLNAGFIEKKMF